MPISLNVTSCVCRCGDNHFKYGDPYEFVFLIQIVDHIAYLTSGNGKFKIKWKDQILNELKKFNVKCVVWTRIRTNGTTHKVQFEI